MGIVGLIVIGIIAWLLYHLIFGEPMKRFDKDGNWINRKEYEEWERQHRRR